MSPRGYCPEPVLHSWSKGSLEAGKKRLAGDMARAATKTEVKDLRREDFKSYEVTKAVGNAEIHAQPDYVIATFSEFKTWKCGFSLEHAHPYLRHSPNFLNETSENRTN